MEDLSSRIAERVGALAGTPVEVKKVTPLSGGACQDNFRVDLVLSGAPHTYALRSDARSALPGSQNRKGEYGVIQAAVEAGVKTPAARWLSDGLVAEGHGAYFMDWVDGVTIGRQLLKDPGLAEARKSLPTELGAELAKLHAITPKTHPDVFLDQAGWRRTPESPRAALEAVLGEQRTLLNELEDPHPAIDLAMRWLDEHKPELDEVVLVHGDFRTGNFCVGPQGLVGLLDWEFAHWGDPAEDLAWVCMRDWRFGQLDKAAGGFATREAMYAAYEKASGRKVSADRVRYYEILSNVRWATGCIQQGQRYLSGQETDLELIAVARRAGEMEFEALRLIQEGAR